MFAAGTAASFGVKTLLIDQYDSSDSIRADDDDDDNVQQELHVGGDCSNAACVPSKAFRSASQVLSAKSSNGDNNIDSKMFQQARQHSIDTVNKVRQRESPERLAQTPNLDLMFVSKASFQDDNDSHTMELERPLKMEWQEQQW